MKTILVVDDEKDILDLLSARLKVLGYEVLASDNGKEALAVVDKKHPDFIFMDIMMPDLNGSEVVAILKNNPKTSKIPVVFLTGAVGTGQSGMSDSGVNIEGVYYDAISKPFSKESLKYALAKYL